MDQHLSLALIDCAALRCAARKHCPLFVVQFQAPQATLNDPTACLPIHQGYFPALYTSRP